MTLFGSHTRNDSQTCSPGFRNGERLCQSLLTQKGTTLRLCWEEPFFSAVCILFRSYFPSGTRTTSQDSENVDRTHPNLELDRAPPFVRYHTGWNVVDAKIPCVNRLVHKANELPLIMPKLSEALGTAVFSTTRRYSA